MVRLNNTAKDNATPVTASTSKGKAKDEEIGIGGSDGLGRQNTITQRSVGTVLPTATSTPPANTNMRGKAGTFAPPPSPSSRVSSPTAPAVARQRQVPGMAKIGPSTSARAFVPPRSQFVFGLYARSVFRCMPVIGSVASLAAARPSTIMALSEPDVDSDTSESASEADSDESDDSEDDIPLQPAAQPRPPRPPRPGTS